MDYFMNESVSDVVFVVEGQRLPALKVLLSIKSKVFRAMFSGHFKESEVEEVVIEDTTYEAFKSLIQFLYCDRLVLKDDNDFKLIEEVCRLSDRYDVKKLLEKVDDLLMAMTLNHNDWVTFNSISKLAFDHNLQNMKSNVLSHIDQNFKDFIAKNEKHLVEYNVITDNHLVEMLAKNYRRVNTELNGIKQDLEMRKCKRCLTIFPYVINHYPTCTICDKP